MELPAIQRSRTINKSFNSDRIRQSHSRSAKKFLNKTLTGGDVTFNKNTTLTKEYYKSMLEQMEYDQVNNNLLQVKKTHDGHINNYELKQQEFKTINAKLNSINYCERKTEEFQKDSQTQINKLQHQLEQVNTQQFLMSDQQQRYKNMLNRLKGERSFWDWKVRKLSEQIGFQKHLLKVQIAKYKKLSEQKTLANKNLSNCSKAFNDELNKNIGYLQALEQTVQSTVTQNAAREELFQHKSDIMESNFYTDKNSQDENLRSYFLVHRIWSFILRRKIEKELRETIEIEKTYRRMVADTGINDIKEIVTRFQNREETYQQLISAINQTEEKVDKKREESDILRKQLIQIELNSQASKKDQEMIQLVSTRDQMKKQLLDMKEKKKFANKVYDQTSDWICKNLNQFYSFIGVKTNTNQVPTGKLIERGKLSEFFESLKLQVESQIVRIKENNESAMDAIVQNRIKHAKNMAKKEIMRVQMQNSEVEKKQLAQLVGQVASPEGAPPPGAGPLSPDIVQERIRVKAQQKENENQLREEWKRQQKEQEQKEKLERVKMLKKMGIKENM